MRWPGLAFLTPYQQPLPDKSETSKPDQGKGKEALAEKQRDKPRQQLAQKTEVAARSETNAGLSLAKKSKHFVTSEVNTKLTARYKIEPAAPRTKEVMQKQKKMEKLIPLPALPDEQDLFTPPPVKITLETISLSLLTWLETLEVNTTLNLHQVAELLNLEAKALSLSCNVLEGLRLMVKVASSSYTWLGKSSMDQGLIWLQQMAEQEMVLEVLIRSCHDQMEQDGQVMEQGQVQQQQDAEEQEQPHVDKLTTGVLTQRLVMTFLAAPFPATLTVRLVSKVIQGKKEVTSYFR